MPMSFGIANNVRSKVRVCTPELFHRAIESQVVAEVCAQIKDALEKVRENFLRYDDVMSNPQLLVGDWESTSNFSVEVNGVETGEHVKLTMTFNSPSEGIMRYHYLDGENIGDICTANIKVEFTNAEITIRDLANPTNETGRRFVRSIYHCTPDPNGFLRASQETEGKTDLLKFNLRKITE